ncbi:MAG: hypothetical protein COA78_20315 [Blastopirellula sp.]|nr:MAG: hypothetical protein COA78_20315 [Blastopirellula sp.]
MAYNYLDIVNVVNRRVNETELTSSNFSSASGYYSAVKDAVNASIRYINQREFEWPFNNTTYDETLVAGTIRYAFQSDAKSVDFDTFRIQRNDTFGNETRPLIRMDYEEYVQKNLIDDEYNTSDTGIRKLPTHVFETPDQEYGVWPAPDAAYTLSYEYYQLPTDLSAHSDIPSIPESFRFIIADGAMYYVYFFRGDEALADRIKVKFDEGIDAMRTIYINRYNSIRDTRVFRNRASQSSNRTI